MKLPEKGNLATHIAALLSLAKLATDVFGYNLFDDQDIDNLANALAIVVVSACGIYMNYRKNR